ncbi:HAD family hydrolase [Erysipelothrix sp. HDW6C]|uniref:HAD family hydrolase n=1 Tax=Erysipelothrix sp. HDW6C TaxID=2714930 RepID=UPI00140A0178|nr:HAD family hydrolase [Erysipelothrix sp. HDW6C]QIK69228.1 HAD family hydrolase [Erysipelothrix sp. HDW6C]
MKILFFDLDDTLYNQIVPFQNAMQTVALEVDDVDALYRLTRQYSDEVFHLSQDGHMTLESTQRYRIQKALTHFNISYSDAQADAFQAAYAYEQAHLCLDEDMEQLLIHLNAENYPIALITNGPSDHQSKKIAALNLERYFDPNCIFISGDIGYYKPDIHIFQHVNTVTGTKPEDCLMIGDSYHNDILGALNAGWNAIWLNHRENTHDVVSLTFASHKDLAEAILQLTQ